MPEPAARWRLREAREQATAEREARETQRPSMLREAVKAAVDALPDVPIPTVEQVALAVLRVALPLHETQHASALKTAHERAVHFELELMKCTDLNRELVNENADMRVELERLRAQVAATELLARNVELGTRAYNAKAKCEDLEDEVERLRAQLAEPEIQWGHQVHADDGHRGDEVPQSDEDAAWLAVAHLNRNVLPLGSRAVVIRREVRIHEGLWRTVPLCECPHTYQPDGGLVRDGVLALGCPAHDPDTGGGDDELAGTEWM